MKDNIQRQLDKVFNHIEIYNREMGGVQAEMKNIKNEICEIRKIIDDNAKKLDRAINQLPNWATYMIGVLMAIIGWLMAR